MIPRVLVPLAVITHLAAVAESPADTQWTGIVQPLGGSSACFMDETHTVQDPCSFTSGLVRSDAVDLDDWACRYVTVEGPTVSVECTVMDVQQITEGVPSCRDDVVRIVSAAKGHGGSIVIEWQETVAPQLPCRESFDVIRGVLPVSVNGTTVDLGAVLCLEEDTEGESATDDTAGPEPGHGFFYLIRPNGAPDFQSYGSSTAGEERTPSTGDCTP